VLCKVRTFKCYGSSDVRTAIFRFLLAILLLYALVIILPLLNNITHLTSGKYDYSIVIHWPFYFINLVLLFFSVPLWRGSQYGSIVLVILSICYIAYAVISDYWPVVHIIYSVTLLLIAYLSFCLSIAKSSPR
jgi:hypothetical protein